MTDLPRAILFDLDETILSFGSRRLILQEVIEMHPQAFGELEPSAAAGVMEAAFRDFWGDEARHAHWRHNLAEGRVMAVRTGFARLREQAPGLTNDFAAEFGHRFHAHREAQARFFPGALETLEHFRRSGVLMALVTNGASAPQRGKIERFDLAHRFDHVQIEGEAGFGKPDPRAYEHAMQTLGVAPQETWMVGDNLEWEVVAPQRLGIYAIWHDHLGEGLPEGSDIRPDRIIRSIAELAPQR